METALGHDEGLKLYVIQYAIGSRNIDVELCVAANKEIAFKEVVKSWEDRYKSVWFKPRVVSIQEADLPDYNINLERKVKGGS